MGLVNTDEGNGSVLWIVWFPIQTILYMGFLYAMLDPTLGSVIKLLISGIIGAFFSFFKTAIMTGDLFIEWRGPEFWKRK